MDDKSNEPDQANNEVENSPAQISDPNGRQRLDQADLEQSARSGPGTFSAKRLLEEMRQRQLQQEQIIRNLQEQLLRQQEQINRQIGMLSLEKNQKVVYKNDSFKFVESDQRTDENPRRGIEQLQANLAEIGDQSAGAQDQLDQLTPDKIFSFQMGDQKDSQRRDDIGNQSSPLVQSQLRVTPTHQAKDGDRLGDRLVIFKSPNAGHASKVSHLSRLSHLSRISDASRGSPASHITRKSMQTNMSEFLLGKNLAQISQLANQKGHSSLALKKPGQKWGLYLKKQIQNSPKFEQSQPPRPPQIDQKQNDIDQTKQCSPPNAAPIQQQILHPTSSVPATTNGDEGQLKAEPAPRYQTEQHKRASPIDINNLRNLDELSQKLYNRYISEKQQQEPRYQESRQQDKTNTVDFKETILENIGVKMVQQESQKNQQRHDQPTLEIGRRQSSSGPNRRQARDNIRSFEQMLKEIFFTSPEQLEQQMQDRQLDVRQRHSLPLQLNSGNLADTGAIQKNQQELQPWMTNDRQVVNNMMTKEEFDSYLKEMLCAGNVHEDRTKSDDLQTIQNLQNMVSTQQQQLNCISKLAENHILVSMPSSQSLQKGKSASQVDSKEAVRGAKQSNANQQQNSSGHVDYVRLGDFDVKAKPEDEPQQCHSFGTRNVREYFDEIRKQDPGNRLYQNSREPHFPSLQKQQSKTLTQNHYKRALDENLDIKKQLQDLGRHLKRFGYEKDRFSVKSHFSGILDGDSNDGQRRSTHNYDRKRPAQKIIIPIINNSNIQQINLTPNNAQDSSQQSQLLPKILVLNRRDQKIQIKENDLIQRIQKQHQIRKLAQNQNYEIQQHLQDRKNELVFEPARPMQQDGPKMQDFHPNFTLNQKSIQNIRKRNFQNHLRRGKMEKANSADSRNERNQSIERFVNDMKQNQLDNSISADMKLNDMSGKSVTKDQFQQELDDFLLDEKSREMPCNIDQDQQVLQDNEADDEAGNEATPRHIDTAQFAPGITEQNRNLRKLGGAGNRSSIDVLASIPQQYRNRRWREQDQYNVQLAALARPANISNFTDQKSSFTQKQNIGKQNYNNSRLFKIDAHQNYAAAHIGQAKKFLQEYQMHAQGATPQQIIKQDQRFHHASTQLQQQPQNFIVVHQNLMPQSQSSTLPPQRIIQPRVTMAAYKNELDQQPMLIAMAKPSQAMHDDQRPLQLQKFHTAPKTQNQASQGGPSNQQQLNVAQQVQQSKQIAMVPADGNGGSGQQFIDINGQQQYLNVQNLPMQLDQSQHIIRLPPILQEQLQRIQSAGLPHQADSAQPQALAAGGAGGGLNAGSDGVNQLYGAGQLNSLHINHFQQNQPANNQLQRTNSIKDQHQDLVYPFQQDQFQQSFRPSQLQNQRFAARQQNLQRREQRQYTLEQIGEMPDLQGHGVNYAAGLLPETAHGFSDPNSIYGLQDPASLSITEQYQHFLEQQGGDVILPTTDARANIPNYKQSSQPIPEAYDQLENTQQQTQDQGQRPSSKTRNPRPSKNASRRKQIFTFERVQRNSAENSVEKNSKIFK